MAGCMLSSPPSNNGTNGSEAVSTWQFKYLFWPLKKEVNRYPDFLDEVARDDVVRVSRVELRTRKADYLFTPNHTCKLYSCNVIGVNNNTRPLENCKYTEQMLFANTDPTFRRVSLPLKRWNPFLTFVFTQVTSDQSLCLPSGLASVVADFINLPLMGGLYVTKSFEPRLKSPFEKACGVPRATSLLLLLSSQAEILSGSCPNPVP